MTNTNTKARILQTAIKAFSRRGFSAVSMRDIATEVGISPPALYNHFKNKEAIYQAAVTHAFQDKGNLLIDSLEVSTPPLERLYQFVRNVSLAMEQDRDFRVFIQREQLDGDADRLRFLTQSIFKPLMDRMHRLLLELDPDCDAFLLTQMIVGMIKHHFETQPLHPYLELEGTTARTPEAVANLAIAILSAYFEGNQR